MIEEILYARCRQLLPFKMKIKKLLATPGFAGFYFDDLDAIRKGAKMDGMFYDGAPSTTGFDQIRQRGESISVLLTLDDGQVAYGDCVAPQYSGAGGRDSLFLTRDQIPIILKDVAPTLVGRELESFRHLAGEVESIEIGGRKLHRAIRYGVTCAILDAVARWKKKTMAEVIADEYGTTVSTKPFLASAQSGDDRYSNVDKMIMKRVDVMPHGLINNLGLLGEKGDRLLEYVKWVRERILTKGEKDFRPIIHIETYGTPGILFQKNLRRIAEFIERMRETARPLEFWSEMPIDAGSTEGQIEAYKELTGILQDKGIKVKLVADEWCTTTEELERFVQQKAADIIKVKVPEYGGINKGIEAALYAKKNKVMTWISESCNSTNKSVECGVHLALATHADVKACAPGMGVDEGVATVYNEMQRVLALAAAG